MRLNCALYSKQCNNQSNRGVREDSALDLHGESNAVGMCDIIYYEI